MQWRWAREARRKGTEKRPPAAHRTSRPAAVAAVGFPRSLLPGTPTDGHLGRRTVHHHQSHPGSNKRPAIAGDELIPSPALGVAAGNVSARRLALSTDR